MTPVEPPDVPVAAETVSGARTVDSGAAPRVLGLVVPPHLAHVIDAALERHVELVLRRGGDVPGEVIALGVAARRLARLHAARHVRLSEHSFVIGGADVGGWVSVAEYAKEVGVGVRAIQRRVARGSLEARRVGRQFFVRLETASG